MQRVEVQGGVRPKVVVVVDVKFVEREEELVSEGGFILKEE
jgi:hypothetical protein